MDDAIIHVAMLKASAIQNPTKFQLVHFRWLLGTGCRSSLESFKSGNLLENCFPWRSRAGNRVAVWT